MRVASFAASAVWIFVSGSAKRQQRHSDLEVHPLRRAIFQSSWRSRSATRRTADTSAASKPAPLPPPIHMDPLCRSGLLDPMSEPGGIHAGHRLSRRRPRLLRGDGALRPLGGRRLRPAMPDLVLGAAVAAVLALYLVAVLIRPEKF
ncbi:potassium-transporting ATPase subunit F [Oharaeibacter diazotrophicus]|uniref:potassium-transporting ATPase subunit F n=1 Tax=Oharaeibacter diazotrophicus TaxID=1920512 RepID=UPI003CCB5018